MCGILRDSADILDEAGMVETCDERNVTRSNETSVNVEAAGRRD